MFQPFNQDYPPTISDHPRFTSHSRRETVTSEVTDETQDTYPTFAPINHTAAARPIMEPVPLPEFEVVRQDGAAVSQAFRAWLPESRRDVKRPELHRAAEYTTYRRHLGDVTPSEGSTDFEQPPAASVTREQASHGMPYDSYEADGPAHVVGSDTSSTQQELLARPPRFEAAWYVRPGLTAEEVEEFKEAFDIFDVHGRGFVDPKEIRRTLLSLASDHRNSTLFMILSEVEKHKKPLDFAAFLDIMTHKVVNTSTFTTRQDVARVSR